MTAEDIVARVAKARGVSVAALKGRSRHASIVRARHEAMFLVRMNTPMSFPEIGRLLKRDHSTVMHGVDVIVGEATGDKYWEELHAILGPNFAQALDAAAEAA